MKMSIEKKQALRKKAMGQARKILDKVDDTVSLYLIMQDGLCMGRIVTEWTYPPMGARAKTALILYEVDGHDAVYGVAAAGGCGYDKFDSTMKQIMADPVVRESLICRGLPVEQYEFKSEGWVRMFTESGYRIMQCLPACRHYDVTPRA